MGQNVYYTGRPTVGGVFSRPSVRPMGLPIRSKKKHAFEKARRSYEETYTKGLKIKAEADKQARKLANTERKVANLQKLIDATKASIDPLKNPLSKRTETK